VLAEMNECGLQPDLCSYNTLIEVYRIAGMFEVSINVIKELGKNEIKPDQKTYTNLIDALK
jgi:pentatricopeptide repeat protein